MAQTKVQLLQPDLGDVIDFDASTLFVDGADNRIGIRNTNPQYELDVTGTINATNFRGNISVGTIDDWIVHTGDTDTKIGFPAADKFQVFAGGGPRTTVTSTGLGIGTDSPSQPLHLNRSSSGQAEFGMRLSYENTAGGGTVTNCGVLVGSTGLKFKNYNSTRHFYFETGNVAIGSNTVPTGTLELSRTNSTDMLTFREVGANALFARIGYNSASGTSILDIRSEGHMRFLTGGNNQQLRIDNTGVIETGTAIGASGFDSNARLRVGRASDCNIAIRVTGNTTSHTGIYFGDSDSASSGYIQYMHNGDYMRFMTNGASASDERLRIDSSGKIGISRTPTQHPLEIQHASEPTVSLWRGSTKGSALQAQSGGTYLYSYQNAPLIFSVNSANGFTERMKIDQNGVVTATGTSDGVLQLDTSDSRGAFIRFGQGGSYHHMIGCADGLVAGPDKEDLGLRAKDNMVFCTNGANEVLRITSAGTVGINRSSPDSNSMLDVMSDKTGTTVNSNRVALFRTNGGGRDAHITLSNSSNTPVHIGQLSSNLYFTTNNEERLRIKSDGYVAIGGYGDPNSILDIRENKDGAETQIRLFNTDNGNTTTQTAALYLSPDSRGTAATGIRAIKENADFSTNAGRDIALSLNTVQNNAQVEGLRIASDGAATFAGKVGLGVSPTYAFQQLRSGAVEWVIGSSNAGSVALVFDGDANGDASGGDYSHIRHTTDGNMEYAARNGSGNAAHHMFKTNTTEQFRIHDDGIVAQPFGPTQHNGGSATAIINTTGRFKVGGNQFQTNYKQNTGVGWYTIAINSGGRASGRIGIRETYSSRHQACVFYAAHHYGGSSNQNCINTIFSSGRHSGNPIGAIRIKAYGTYDGALLQVYLRDASHGVTAYLLGDNMQDQGWVMKDWIADGTDPGGMSNWSAINSNGGVSAYSDMNEIQGGGASFDGHVIPGRDDTVTLGRGSYRWDEIFCMNSSNTTSDERLKQDIASLTTAEMNAAKRMSALFKTYRWKNRVAEKGDKARTHTGIIAQQVKAALEAESLDPKKYSFYCFNEWYEDSEGTKLPIETATREGDSVEEGTNATLGGNIVVPTGFEKKSLYSIRISELLAFIAAYNEQRFASIESRLTALES